MSKPLDTVLTFTNPSIRLPNVRKSFQGLLYDRICEHLDSIAFVYPATYVARVVRHRIQRTRIVRRPKTFER